MSRTCVKYRLYFDESFERCVELMPEGHPTDTSSVEVICATLPPLEEGEHPSEASVRRLVEAFFPVTDVVH